MSSEKKIKDYMNKEELDIECSKCIVINTDDVEKASIALEKDLKTIQLFDEDGNEINFNVIAFFDMVNPETDEKSEYVIVQEVGYEDENPFALKIIKDEEDNDMFELIDNEVELAAVEEAYNTIFMEEE